VRSYLKNMGKLHEFPFFTILVSDGIILAGAPENDSGDGPSP